MSLFSAFDFAAANQGLENTQELSIRCAEPQDLAPIATIEHQTAIYPCSNQQMQDCIDQTIVLLQGSIVIGFAVIVSVENQAELHNIAIAPQQQAVGFGSLFLNALISALPSIVEKIYLEVRVSNFRAIRLYQRMGFSKIAERKDYYRYGLGREDAVIMARVCR